MNTPPTCRRGRRRAHGGLRGAAHQGTPRGRKAAVRTERPRGLKPAARFLVGAIALATLPAGCGYAGGELLYMLGFGRAKKVEAKFRLTDEAILILVDDPGHRLDWPMAKRHLTDSLGQALIKNDAAKRVIPFETLTSLRQDDPNIDRRGCREMGQIAGAEQVIWIEVQDFRAVREIETDDEAAYFTVSVKVINAGTREPGARARLWPVSPRGHTSSVALKGGDILRLKTRNGVSKELAGKLAKRIARLFYDHRLNDFESDR